MGNFPRPLLRQQPSLVVSHAVGALPTFPDSRKHGAACHTAVVFPPVYAGYEVGRVVRVRCHGR